jgi:ABC-2 type transport system permease protein
MNPTLTIATAARVLAQLRRDRRTIALVMIVPCVLLWLFKEVFANQPQVFQHIAPAMLGVFPLLMMFLVTSVAMVRERTSGTLERLMTTPLAKTDLIVGYGLAFGLLALVQAMVATTVLLWLLGLNAPASVPVLLLVAVADALLGTALGLGVSALAATEFQAVQFMPAVILPQFLLCGLLTPTGQMASWLDALSRIMPLRYGVDAITRLASAATVQATVWWDLTVIAACVLLALTVGSATLRRVRGLTGQATDRVRAASRSARSLIPSNILRSMTRLPGSITRMSNSRTTQDASGAAMRLRLISRVCPASSSSTNAQTHRPSSEANTSASRGSSTATRMRGP